jgi:hypothetical protein
VLTSMASQQGVCALAEELVPTPSMGAAGRSTRPYGKLVRPLIVVDLLRRHPYHGQALSVRHRLKCCTTALGAESLTMSERP